MGLKENIGNSLRKVSNYWFPVPESGGGGAAPMIRQNDAKNLNRYISPVQFARLRIDVKAWRDAIIEAEQAYYPHRVKIQRVYQDTILNGHVDACMKRRRNLTLMKDFHFVNEAGVENEELTKLFKSKWFYNLQSYMIDAIFYGYSLVGLGDVVDGNFPNIELIRRWNVSPDRGNITSYVYSLSGLKFNDPTDKDPNGQSYYDWSIWCPTPTETGAVSCGYGLLYKVALYEIYLRNLLGYNGDFVELYSQPYRVGKTMKTEGPERDTLEQALRDMGSSGYAIIDPTDEIEFLETALGGTGYMGYDNLEQRCEKKISKIFFGHADTMDSTPGKLGDSGAEDDGVGIAMREVETHDNGYVEDLVNDQLVPKLRNIGFIIPNGYSFRYKNDKQLRETREAEDKANLATATVMKTLSDAGYEVKDFKYFEERMGFALAKKEVEPTVDPLKANKKLKDVINKLYGTV